MVSSCRALKYMVSVLFFPLLPFIFMLVTIGYWAASAIFLASMGKADFSLVNKTTYTDADGEVQTVKCRRRSEDSEVQTEKCRRRSAESEIQK